MALRMSTDLKTYIVNQGIVHKMAGTTGNSGTGSIKIYSGSQPASADTEVSSEVLLCTISGLGWGGTNGATQGTANFGSAGGYTGTAGTSGTAGWARMETVGVGYTGSAATFRMDGDVGTASTCTFVVNSVAVTAAGLVTIVSAPISIS